MTSPVSSLAKAGDPVISSASTETLVSGLLGAPPSRGMTTNVRSCGHLHAGDPIFPQAVAQDLTAVALGKIRDDKNLLRHFCRRQESRAMLVYGVFSECDARLGDSVAYHLLSVDLIGHADRRCLENSGVLQQDLIDLDRGDVHAAPDDQVLGAAGEANKAVRVLDAEVTGLDTLGADSFDRSVIHQIADRGVRAARRYLALDAGRAGMAVRIDDSEFLVQRRDADRADAVFICAVAAHPAGLRHTVHLQELDPVHLLKLQPLLRGERCRRATHQPQGRQVLRPLFAFRRPQVRVGRWVVQQHVENGWHTGRKGDAVLPDPPKETAAGEAFGDVHRQSLLQERHQAQYLRGVPAKGPIFQRAIILGETEKFEGGQAIEPVGAVVIHHDLGPAGGSRGAEDAGDVLRRVPLGQVGGGVLRQAREQVVLRIAAAGRPRAKPDARCPAVANQRIDFDVLVPEDQYRIHRQGKVGQYLCVDFDVERAHDRTETPDTEPEQQLFQIFIGEQKHAAALTDAAALEQRRNVGRDLIELTERDRGSGFQIDDRGLRRIAVAVLREQLRDWAVRDTGNMITEYAVHVDLMSAS